MKKLLYFVSIIFIAIPGLAQKHEVGIGIGYLEFNPYKDSYYGEKWHSSLPGSGKSIDHDLIYFNQKFNKRQSYPALYYTFICRKFSIASGFQFTKNDGRSDPDEIWFDGNSTYQYNIRKYDATIGLNYQIFSCKRINVYTGIHLNAVWMKSNENGIYSDSWTGVYNQPYNIDELKSDYFLLHNAGIQYKLCKKWNTRFEIAIRNDEMFYLRPLNRLSLNYQF